MNSFFCRKELDVCFNKIGIYINFSLGLRIFNGGLASTINRLTKCLFLLCIISLQPNFILNYFKFYLKFCSIKLFSTSSTKTQQNKNLAMQQCRLKSFLPGNHNGYDIIFTLRLSYLYYVHRNFLFVIFFWERWKNMWHSRAFKSFHLRCFTFFVVI